ncbi:MAG: hypothetical protein A2511_15905 [Deltaproteobacteria bacterium RIFOXYD12_FULL_50_9]|nr:MAG: hypothetical protein A2511_15905 [Deltaproteobacteria bacterium RIFOXYD12_FULL_50_9]
MNTGTISLLDMAMTEDLSVQVDAPLRELIRLMQKNGKGVVVILKGDIPVGIITERDVVSLLYTQTNLDDLVERWLGKSVIAARGERNIGYALSLMIENTIRRLVVVDEANRFLGVVTQQDLMNQLEEDFYRSSLRVKHLLDKLRALVSGSRADTISTILEKMVRHKISAVPILENGLPVGIITEKDILKLAGREVPLTDSVTLYMTSPVNTADLETPLINIVKEMNVRSTQRVVITDHNGMALGVITSRDLMRNVELDYNEFLERKLKYSKEVLNLLPEMLIEVIDTGENQLVVWANEKALGRFGNGIIDKDVADFIPAETWLKIYNELARSGKVEDVRFKKENSIYEFSGFYMRLDRNAEKGRVQLIMRDITEEVMFATTDTLTNIYNRRYMNEFLAKEVERGRRRSAGFAVAIADVDDFKKVNDTYGHPAGDLVLRKIVEHMMENLRKYDIIGRYGGEEFLLIMPEVDKHNALLVVERMRQAISIEKIELPTGRHLTITISIGIAVFDEDGNSPDDLLIKADERLYKAKRAGKNCSFIV